MPDLELGLGDRSGTGVSADPKHIASLLDAIDVATARLLAAFRALDERTIHAASLLPGWTRAHVASHLARNADGSVNLLVWARTGVEHPMYASREDRDADIREGEARNHRILLEDLTASAERFGHAARALPDSAWSVEVVRAPGKPIPVYQTLRDRLLELWVHLVDLDCGVGFDDIPQSDAESLLNDTVRQFAGRPDVPAVTVSTDFDDGRSSTWHIGSPQARDRHVRGRPGQVLGWLLGRYGPQRLHGDAPELPPWL